MHSKINISRLLRLKFVSFFHNKPPIVEGFGVAVFSVLLLSCTQPFPDQFLEDNSKKDQVFSIEEVKNAACRIRTGRALTTGSLKSSSKKLEIQTESHGGFNNLPFVEYQPEGPGVCQKLLNQSSLKLSARPHFSYDVRFQIIGTWLRIWLTGDLKDLPYQNMSQLKEQEDGRFAVLIGGHEIQQGEVRNVKNVEQVETYILDFFPQTNPTFEPVQGFHYIRKNANSILIPSLAQGFLPVQHLEKKDVFPKSYFDGVWHFGVSVISADPLFIEQGFFGGSGLDVSGDSFFNTTSGQKVYFHFSADHLQAFNENLKKQSEGHIHAAEAEALSIPIQHVDYKIKDSKLYPEGGIEEEVFEDKPWQERQYIQMEFSQIEFVHNKMLKIILGSIPEFALLNLETASVTVEEARFFDDYFDLVISEGNLKYRLSFRKKKENSYKPQSLSQADLQFDYFHMPDTRVFPDPERSFQQDLEDNVFLFKINPNARNRIVLNFSTLTPKEDKVRNIGREAVSLWNQALRKAGLSLSLVIDETQDVPVGDIRYHVLNIPREQTTSYSGIAQWYVDDETGEVLSSSSNLPLPKAIDLVKQYLVLWVYEEYGLASPLSNPAVSSSMSFLKSSPQISRAGLHSLLIQDKVHTLLESALSVTPRSGIQNYFKTLGQAQYDFSQAPLDLLSLTQNPQGSSSFQKALQKLKLQYTLRTGRLMEDSSYEQVRENMGCADRWNGLQNLSSSAHFNKMAHLMCDPISHPLENKKGFEEDVERCAEKLYPIYALGTMVHEIGHSIFSLRHNFAGSTDKNNFYPQGEYNLKFLDVSYADKNGEKRYVLEEEFPSVSSSVMDYSHLAFGEQWFPGPYDVQAVKFLYGGQKDPGLKFKRCTDEHVADSTYCLRWDNGSSPEEIAFTEVQNLFRRLDSYFYSAGRTPRSWWAYYAGIAESFDRLMVIYYDWRKRFSHWVSTKGYGDPWSLPDSDWYELLQSLVEQGQSPGADFKEKELLSFYKARNLIYHTFSYIAFIPNRYCVLKLEFHGGRPQKTWGSLETLVELSQIIQWSQDGPEDFQDEIVSCFADEAQTSPHPIVEEYLKTHYPHHTLMSERGHFLFPSQSLKNAPYLGLKNPLRHHGTFTPRAWAFMALTLSGQAFGRPEGIYSSMMNERDIEQAVERMTLARTTKGMFEPQVEFFQSLEEISLEELTPDTSAEILFQFPMVKEGMDPIFRDELIQPDKLLKYAQSPYTRDDQHEVQFYQNFSEEQSLIYLFNQFYALGKVISGGGSFDELTQRSADFYDDVNTALSMTGNLINTKADQYFIHEQNPLSTAQYYFEFDEFLLTPLSGQKWKNNMGSEIIAELAKNTVRNLWTDASSSKFFGNPQMDPETRRWKEGGFAPVLLNFLQNLLRHQGSRLGRAYFIYAYTLVLALFESYEVMADHASWENMQELHLKVHQRMSLFVSTMQRLFYTTKCNTELMVSLFSRPLESDENGRLWPRAYQSGEEKFQYDKQLQEVIETLCPEGTFSNRGKLHVLFERQQQLLNKEQSYSAGEVFQNPLFKELGLGAVRNPLQEFTENFYLDKHIRGVESDTGGFVGFHLNIYGMFVDLFPFSQDVSEIKKWIRAFRQMLLDTIPKLMIMYSEDRYFPAEAMWIMGEIYNACFYSYLPAQACGLTIEKTMSYYFSGNPYGSNPQLERAFLNYLSGRQRLSDGGMSLQDLINFRPKRVLDKRVNILPLYLPMIADALFYERRWQALRVQQKELDDQRDLLFMLLPSASQLRFVNRSLYYR